MPKRAVADELAEECVRVRGELRQAGRHLHDDIASLLAVAGLRLQLLQLDYPEAAERAREVAEALEAAVENVRALGRRLEQSPVRRTGLKNALLDLAEAFQERTGILVVVKYAVTVALSPEIAEALYVATAAAVEHAAKHGGQKKITIHASGSKKITVRVGYGTAAPGVLRELEKAILLGRYAGVTISTQTKKGTIVSIQYAVQRSSRR